MAIYNNITELIGKTPIVKLNNIVPEGAADVYVKLEAFNPGSSVKDRIALGMIEKAEQEGKFETRLYYCRSNKREHWYRSFMGWCC